MNRTPWRIRVFILAAVNALAAVGITVTVTVSDDLAGAINAAMIAVFTLLADLGLLKEGEANTTPVDDPRGPDGMPMLTWSAHQQAVAALTRREEPQGVPTVTVDEAFEPHESG